MKFTKQIYESEISGSHGGEYEDDCLLGATTQKAVTFNFFKESLSCKKTGRSIVYKNLI
jgi:hypothetical protein